LKQSIAYAATPKTCARPSSFVSWKPTVTKNVKLVNQFKALADKKGCSTSQLSIAWLLKQGDDIIPIPGTKKIKYLEDNWGALNVHLTNEEEAEIRNFAETADIAGGCIPPMFEDRKATNTKEES
jgi:aryl-alcohol dehydrogenase-like predicted oxidoreductase